MCDLQREVSLHQESGLYLGSEKPVLLKVVQEHTCKDVTKDAHRSPSRESHSLFTFIFRCHDTNVTMFPSLCALLVCLKPEDQPPPICLKTSSHVPCPRLNPTRPPSSPSPHSWSLRCFYGDTKPCTLKSALGRQMGETDNNIPLLRQTATQTKSCMTVWESLCAVA